MIQKIYAGNEVVWSREQQPANGSYKQLILSYITHQKYGITGRDLSAKLSLNRSTVTARLTELAKEGKIVAVDGTNPKRWVTPQPVATVDWHQGTEPESVNVYGPVTRQQPQPRQNRVLAALRAFWTFCTG